MTTAQQVHIDPLIKAFAQEIEAKLPQDVLNQLGKLEAVPAIAAQEGSALQTALSFLNDIKDHVPEEQAAKLGKDYGFIYSKLVKKHFPKNGNAADITNKAAEIVTEFESACAKHTLRAGKFNTATREFFERKTGLMGEELNAFTKEAESFFHPIKLFFKDPMHEMRWGRTSAAAFTGIGLAGGTLYLLTRQKETAQEKQAWADRVEAHAEQQQGMSAQR